MSQLADEAGSFAAKCVEPKRVPLLQRTEQGKEEKTTGIGMRKRVNGGVMVRENCR